jgi:hypothetical protein
VSKSKPDDRSLTGSSHAGSGIEILKKLDAGFLAKKKLDARVAHMTASIEIFFSFSKHVHNASAQQVVYHNVLTESKFGANAAQVPLPVGVGIKHWHDCTIRQRARRWHTKV